MVIAGLTGYGDILTQAANLIYTIINSYNKKVSVLDFKNLKDVKTLKSYIQEIQKNHSDFLILKIDTRNFAQELLGYIELDIILYTNETDTICGWNIYDYSETIEKMLPFLSDKGRLILNEDFLPQSPFIKDLEYLTVTYGFNSKAQVTTSSISDTLFGREFIFYQQRSIKTIDGRYICPQEYRINTGLTNVDIYMVLGAITFALVGGIYLKHNIPIAAIYDNTDFFSPFLSFNDISPI